MQARGGLHLVQVIDRRESRVPPFSEVQAAIQAKEQERVFRLEIAKYMVELEKKSLVVANPPAEAANFRRQLTSQTTGDEGDLGLGGEPGGARPRPPRPCRDPAAPPPTAAPSLGVTPPTATAAEPTAPGTLPIAEAGRLRAGAGGAAATPPPPPATPPGL